MIIYLFAVLIYLGNLFIFITEKQNRKFYLIVLLSGSILGPVFDVANFFFNYYDYFRFSFLILNKVPPIILGLYGPCCVVCVFFAEKAFSNRV